MNDGARRPPRRHIHLLEVDGELAPAVGPRREVSRVQHRRRDCDREHLGLGLEVKLLLERADLPRPGASGPGL
eukprot:CAMPEP_0180329824 /NCGR_PEP_ID=MMETSP0988-20121125/40988_1 /TAXON_ID=697907 /ORGANISM="non described non described, Strain CCMP2293" /LENGTH=72 /DNA_ID=CAMNT_0022316995 /DNA_START=414 /DNA_END=632 /DNA_ORIENTATION=+